MPDSGVNDKERPRKKGRRRAINAQKKLCLICKCCKHSSECKPRNKLAFWEIIRKILRDQTCYDLKKLRNTVFCWVADQRERLVLEKIGSGMQVDQDNFKATVK